MEFRDLMVQLRNDSKAYHFCRDGLKGLASATSVEQCISLLRENIVYCFDSDYHQAIADNIEEWYRRWKTEFNRCGIWVNENTDNEKGIIIWNSLDGLTAKGKERVFRFGKMAYAVFMAIDHAKIYSKESPIKVILAGHSHGFIYQAHDISVMNSATCYAEKTTVRSTDACRLFLTSDCNWVGIKGHKTYAEILHVGFQ